MMGTLPYNKTTIRAIPTSIGQKPTSIEKNFFKKKIHNPQAKTKTHKKTKPHQIQNKLI